MAKDQTRRQRTVKQQSANKPSPRDHRATAHALFTEAEQARYDHAQALTWARQDFASLERDVVELCRTALKLWERVGALGERYHAHAKAAGHKLDLVRECLAPYGLGMTKRSQGKVALDATTLVMLSPSWCQAREEASPS